jgi:hypothetical protein
MRIELENGRIPTDPHLLCGAGHSFRPCRLRWTDGCEASGLRRSLNKATGFWAPAAKEVVKLSFC